VLLDLRWFGLRSCVWLPCVLCSVLAMTTVQVCVRFWLCALGCGQLAVVVCDWFSGSIHLCYCVFDSVVQVVIYSLRLEARVC